MYQSMCVDIVWAQVERFRAEQYALIGGVAPSVAHMEGSRKRSGGAPTR